MWKQIGCKEKCEYLRFHNNSLYTYPSALIIEDNPDQDVTYHHKSDNSPRLLIKKGWNDKGLWETTYWKCEV